MRVSNATRAPRTLALGWLLLTAAILNACGGGSESDSQATRAPAQSVATATPAAAAPSMSPSAAPGSATDELARADQEQVPEPDEVADSTPVISGPTLKFASTATPEPKAAPSSFREGVHYQRLVPTQPTGASPGQVEVLEVFWYGSSHSFALYPKLEAWRQKNKANYVVFKRMPGGASDAALFHGRVFYITELLDKLDELHPLIFREVHLNGNLLNTMDKAKAFFAANGVAKADFDKTFASFALESKLQNASLLMRRYRLTGVPSFVVNGKFTTDMTRAGGEEQLLQLLSELAAREHGG